MRDRASAGYHQLVKDPRVVVSLLAVGIATGIATIDFGGIAPDLDSILAPVLMSVAALVGIVAAPPRPLPWRLDALPLALIGAWLAWSLVGAATSARPALALASTVAFALVAVAMLGVVQVSGRSGLLTSVGVAVGLHAGTSIVMANVLDHDQFPSRLALIELEANQLGRLLALVVLLAVLWVLEHPLRRWAPVLALAGVSLLGLVLTGSRTAPTALVVAGAAALIAARRWRLLIGGSAVLALLFGGLLITGFDAKVVQLTNRTPSELTNLTGGNGRTTLWPEVRTVIAEQPITGVGLGLDRQRIVQMNAESEAVTWDPQHAHSLILHLALTTGWVGTFLFLAGLVAGLVAAVRWRDPWVAAVISFLCVDGVSEALLRWPQPTFAVLIGVLGLGWFGAVEGERAPLVAASETASEWRRRFEGRSPAPVANVMTVAAVALGLAIALVWLEPGRLPHTVRCLAHPAMSGGAVVVADVDDAQVRTENDTVAVGSERIGPDGLVFEPGDLGQPLPDETAASVRCGALRTGALTIELEVATADLTAAGPARIVSIADGTEWSDIDLMVGQDGDALAVRVRQSRTYRNDVSIPGVFVDNEAHRLVIIIEADRVRVWRDDVLIETWTDFEPLLFDEWWPDRSAAIGNSVTRDRPFVGSISEFVIRQGVVEPTG